MYVIKKFEKQFGDVEKQLALSKLIDW
jgi:hypothetical protein